MREWLGGLAGVAMIASALCSAPALAQSNSVRTPDLYRLLKLDGNLVRWQNVQGEPVTITYKVLIEFQAFSGARNCRRMTGIDGLAQRSGIDTIQFDTALRDAFAMWEEAANIRFREAEPGEPANIAIGAQQEPEGWAFADVFYDARSDGQFKPISQALVCLNPEKLWKVGFDGDLKTYDLRYTLAHEIGHAIGLDHPSNGDQIMNYRYEERFSELQSGDVSGAATLYGAPQPRESIVARAHRMHPAPAPGQQSSTMTRALNPPRDAQTPR